MSLCIILYIDCARKLKRLLLFINGIISAVDDAYIDIFTICIQPCLDVLDVVLGIGALASLELQGSYIVVHQSTVHVLNIFILNFTLQDLHVSSPCIKLFTLSTCIIPEHCGRVHCQGPPHFHAPSSCRRAQTSPQNCTETKSFY